MAGSPGGKCDITLSVGWFLVKMQLWTKTYAIDSTNKALNHVLPVVCFQCLDNPLIAWLNLTGGEGEILIQ